MFRDISFNNLAITKRRVVMNTNSINSIWAGYDLREADWNDPYVLKFLFAGHCLEEASYADYELYVTHRNRRR